MQNLNNKTDGMPKIAEQFRKNKLHVVIVLAMAAIVVGVYFIKTKTHKDVEQHVEESYTLKSDVVPVKTPVTSTAQLCSGWIIRC